MKSKKKYKGFYTWRNIIPRMAFTMYLAMYSTKYLDVEIIKPWLGGVSDNTLRIMVIFIAYILSCFITTQWIKYHKVIKIVYIINAIIFLLIMLYGG